MPWATVFDNVWLPLRLKGQSRATRQAGDHGGAGQGRPRRLRQRLSARALGRHEDARLDRPRAGDAAGAAADGRAVRRARRDHPQQAQRRSRRAEMRARRDRGVRHPFRLRERLSLRPHRGDGAAPGPRRRRDRDPGAAAARRGFPPDAALRRALPRDLGRAASGDEHGARAFAVEPRPDCAAMCCRRWRWSARWSPGRRWCGSTISSPSSCRRRAWS